eukprot:Em0018g638a
METVSWSIPGVYTKKAEIEISRGELLIRKGDLLRINGNENAAFEFHTECENIAPLFSSVQYNLLKAIATAQERISVFATPGWLDWGGDVKKGDEVYIRVIKDGIKCCSTAVVHYIGTLTGDHLGIMFGVEITDSRYYGCGTSGGVFNKIRYFSCPDCNGLFLSLASVANQPNWLKLEYRQPKRDIVAEGMQKDSNNGPIPAKRINKESASPNMEINRADVDTKQLCYGSRVSVMTKDGKKVKGTVRWAGELPLESDDPKKKIPVYGVETDVRVRYDQIEPIIVLKGRPQFGASPDHGRVFIPQTMVELDVQINDSDTTETKTKSMVGAKDVHKEVGVDNDERKKTELKFQNEKAASPQDSVPEIGSHQPSVVVPAQGDWATPHHVGIGSAVVISNSNPPMYGTIRWIGTMPQVHGYVAGMELETPVAGCTDGVWLRNGVPVRYFDCPPNKGYFCLLEQLVPDQRYMASSKALNNSINEQRTHWKAEKTIETLEDHSQEESIDQYHNEVTQSQVMEEHNQAVMEQEQAMKEREQVSQERDQAMKERDQARREQIQMMNERDQAMKERDQVMKERDQATMRQDQAMKERDQATMRQDQAMKERDQATLRQDQAMKERDQAMKERDQATMRQDQAMKERDQATMRQDQAMKERDHATMRQDQAMKERDQATMRQDQAIKERDQAMKERDEAIRGRDQARKERNQSAKERDQAKKAQIHKVMEHDSKLKEQEQAIKERDQATKECNRILKEWDKTKKELEILKQEYSKRNAFWIVPRRHVTVLERSLGDGAWGNVREGKFRGQQVAVKCVHEAIFSKQTMQRVYREICTMSQVHHPNLVLFIAAVLDDQGGPMIITELLDTTLRKAYEDNLLSQLVVCMDIFRDVASALCYLHGLEEPIIHRDVSSANVLLKAVAKGEWKAKLSDFGSANWAKEASTMGEGAIVYTAPEAYPVHPSLNVKPPPQTTKIDVTVMEYCCVRSH